MQLDGSKRRSGLVVWKAREGAWRAKQTATGLADLLDQVGLADLLDEDVGQAGQIKICASEMGLVRPAVKFWRLTNCDRGPRAVVEATDVPHWRGHF